MESDDPRLAAAARHALHDEEVVAGFAVDGEVAEDGARARALIERCATCRDLHADMVAIGAVFKAAGTAEAVGALRPAPRDFRLTATDAVRLRGGNALQRGIARFRDGLAAFGRPVGAGLAAFGVVGLLVGSMTLGSLGGAPTSAEGAGAKGPAATAAAAPGGQPAQTATTDGSNQVEPTPELREELTPLSADDLRQGTRAPSLLFAGSIALVVIGAALLLAGSRRPRHGPARNRART
jgi:hypothetical protein